MFNEVGYINTIQNICEKHDFKGLKGILNHSVIECFKAHNEGDNNTISSAYPKAPAYSPFI